MLLLSKIQLLQRMNYQKHRLILHQLQFLPLHVDSPIHQFSHLCLHHILLFVGLASFLTTVKLLKFFLTLHRCMFASLPFDTIKNLSNTSFQSDISPSNSKHSTIISSIAILIFLFFLALLSRSSRRYFYSC